MHIPNPFKSHAADVVGIDLTQWAVTVAVVVAAVHRPIGRIWVLQHGIINRSEVLYGTCDCYALRRLRLGA